MGYLLNKYLLINLSLVADTAFVNIELYLYFMKLDPNFQYASALSPGLGVLAFLYFWDWH